MKKIIEQILKEDRRQMYLNNIIKVMKDDYPIIKNLKDYGFWEVLTKDEISIIYNGKVKNANYYKTITFKYNYINDMQSRAERVTGVNGWVMVKYKPVSSYWYKGNDNLQGNFVMNGASRLEDEEWSIAWDDNHYNQVLFVKGDFAIPLYFD